eukprot:TRINITY_DN508_c0_g2_i1.p1 TRINITY_DN508_c0_g2~~TRINITY_DN508_c0_g2_i1.p1  ORF type:complete len:358 (+),score=94.51 TRINITY_DN508_c0_g2_i1:36-1109(+)
MDLLNIFGAPVTIEFKFDGQEDRKTVDIHSDKGTQKLLLYTGLDPVKGKVICKVKPGKKVDHEGIKVEFIGQIDVVYDRGNHYDFISQVQELSGPGSISGETVFDFDFSSVEKPHESYNGLNVRLRYFVKFDMKRGLVAPNVSKEQDIWVINYQNFPQINSSIKMEVGIEDCLHIEFEYARAKYHLKDVILGKIYFLLVRIKIKYMELALVKRESTGTAPNLYTESETLTKFEIMDGSPVRGESVPVRLFLGAFDLTPTYKNVHAKFSVKYLLNLVLVDEEDRRYFKQTDITLWRKKLDGPEAEGLKKLITVRDADYALKEAKEMRKKKRKEKKDKEGNQQKDEEKEEKDDDKDKSD